jgi:hypothetical protein
LGTYRPATPKQFEEILGDLRHRQERGTLNEAEKEFFKAHVNNIGLHTSTMGFWEGKRNEPPARNDDDPDYGMMYVRNSALGAQEDLLRLSPNSPESAVSIALDALKYAPLSPEQVLQLRALLPEGSSLGADAATKSVDARLVDLGGREAIEMSISVNGTTEQVLVCPNRTANNLAEATQIARALDCTVVDRGVTDALMKQLLGMERAFPIATFSEAERMALDLAYGASSISYVGGRAVLKDGEVKHFDQNSAPNQGFYLLKRRPAAQ